MIKKELIKRARRPEDTLPYVILFFVSMWNVNNLWTAVDIHPIVGALLVIQTILDQRGFHPLKAPTPAKILERASLAQVFKQPVNYWKRIIRHDATQH